MICLPKLRTLCLYKRELCPELYLLINFPRRVKIALAKFRICNHELYIEKGRHNNVPCNERFCKLCVSINSFCIEDEYHVLLECPFYKELRNLYIDLRHLPVNMYTFTTIMSSEDANTICRLGLFIANMFKVRKLLLMSL